MNGWVYALVLPLLAAPSPKHPPAPVRRAPLPMLPSVSHVRIDVRGDGVVVEQRLLLPRGDWRGGEISFCSAFGAPSAPLAIDAKIFPVEDGALEADDHVAGESLNVEVVSTCPPSAHPLLGPQKMAGALLHLNEAALRKAFSPGKMAEIRIRTKVPVPRPTEDGVRDLVVRLGMHDGLPLTLGRVSIDASSLSWIVTSAEARLCGSDADAYPLAVNYKARRATLRAEGKMPLAPVLAVRHSTDDLCVRFTLGEPRR